jgi:hypothetical protein
MPTCSDMKAEVTKMKFGVSITCILLFTVCNLVAAQGKQESKSNYPSYVEQDISILCGKYTGIKKHKNSNIKVTCAQIKEGYLDIYANLKNQFFLICMM